MLTGFVHLCCYNKNTISWMTAKTTIYFSQVWRLGSPKSRHQEIQYLVRASLFIDGCFLTVSSHGRWARGFSGVSFLRALILIIKAPLS